MELIKWKCCSDNLIKWIIYNIYVSIYYFMRNNIKISHLMELIKWKCCSKILIK
jgi:hypothetical protein